MSITNKSNKVVGGLVSLAAFFMMASCANDTTADSTKEATSSADTTNMMAADSGTAVKPVIAKKKGKVSAAYTTSGSNSTSVKIAKGKDGVYSQAEKMPEYPGGESALSKFVENNISYPQDAIDQNTEGTVKVNFVVDEKGKVVNPMVEGKSLNKGLDDEAIKVVKQMPAWKPGMVKGKPVKTRLSLPVTFKLGDA